MIMRPDAPNPWKNGIVELDGRRLAMNGAIELPVPVPITLP